MTDAQGRPGVLFISPDPVGEQMSGLGIRYAELGGVVAQHATVTIAHGGPDAGPLPENLTLVPYAPHAPKALAGPIAAADVVVAPPQWPVVARWLGRARARVVYDLYTPETLETLELFARRPLRRRRVMHHATLDRLHDALASGDHFVCASETQRDLWLGALIAQRRIDPEAYDRDPSLRSLIDVVPFGLPSQPPAVAPGASGPRERFAESIGADAELVLWNGGLWNWLDAPTAVRAVAALLPRRPKVRLLFMGAASREAGRAATAEARELAAELGVLDRAVVFNDDWVPYGERAAWLAQADVALSTHRDTLEARFAFRTRLLDCFWAGLPIVCTRGDDLAQRVERDGLGATVAPGDPEALAAALEHVLDRGRAAYADALARTAADFTWPRVAQPLVRWVTTPEPPTRAAVRGAAGRTLGHRLRATAYVLGGRALLLRRSAAAGTGEPPADRSASS